jgi:predicted nucleic acid-binding protein
VIEEAIDARLELVLAQPAMVELERILTGKLGFEPERWREVEELLVDLAAELVPAPEGPAEAVTGDPADDLILACTVQAQVDALVSGDRRHLLPVGEHRGVRVITPQALLAEMRGA